MEIIVELVLQVLIEGIGEALIEFGFRGAARVVRSRVGRAAVSVAVGAAFGLWWGGRLSGFEYPDRPRLFWVSVALAVVMGAAALLRRRQPTPNADGPVINFLLPWRWRADRLLGFALLNVAVAAGIAIGWEPSVLR